jgi:sulfhydrogenase subunit beta (sulfur reductase)
VGIKKINEKQLLDWLARLIAAKRVFGIQAKGDKFDFQLLEKAEDLRLDYDVSVNPPKVFFQPPVERLVRFAKQDFSSVLDDEKPFILFGVHPYDVAAISQMDKIFEQGNNDIHYFARRKKATIVACDVQNASKNAFSGYLGFATVDKGFDILITKIKAGYFVDAPTEKGKDLLAFLPSSQEIEPQDLEEREAVWQNNKKLLQKLALNAKPAEITAALAEEKAYNHPIWEEKAARCFSCGSCNLVCPTCYCFDVQDDVEWNLQSGWRYRCWDGCMLEHFATVAGNHNFRKNRADRYRHRYYRKGKYIPDKIGEFSCVGCGRCISACVTHIAHPPEVFNRIMEDLR